MNVSMKGNLARWAHKDKLQLFTQQMKTTQTQQP